MTLSVYVSSIEANSGKALVCLGILDFALGNTQRVGFFRPIIGESAGFSKDPDIDLMIRYFDLKQTYEASYGWHQADVNRLLSQNKRGELLEGIIAKYKQLEAECDFILIEGTDYETQFSALEFDLNCVIANDLGSPVLIVGNAAQQSVIDAVSSTRIYVDFYMSRGCVFTGIIMNKVDPVDLDAMRTALIQEFKVDGIVFSIIPFCSLLQSPTVHEVIRQLEADILIAGSRLSTTVSSHLIGAMQLEHLFPRIHQDQLLLIPGDRTDLLLGLLLIDASSFCPRIAGVLLASGYTPSRAILDIIKGANPTLPILSTHYELIEASNLLHTIKPRLVPEDATKIKVALKLFQENVALSPYEQKLRSIPTRGLSSRMFTYSMIQRARSSIQHIVLPEGEELRILKAAHELTSKKIVKITLLGDPDRISALLREEGMDFDPQWVQIINPAISHDVSEFAETYYQLRKHKGITVDAAHDRMLDVSFYGTMMVHKGLADGMVSGSVHTTQHTILPAFQFIKTQPNVSIVSSIFFMCLDDGVVVYGDCAVNPFPTVNELAEIAISSALTAKTFGIDPKVALLSYSSGTSGEGEDVERVRAAVARVRALDPMMKVEGPIQYDAAVDEGVAALKMPGSKVAGHANVLIFPDLNTGNNTYKAVQRETGAIAIGPILQGLRKPVNDLSRGCSIEDIVNTVIITAIQAQDN